MVDFKKIAIGMALGTALTAAFSLLQPLVEPKASLKFPPRVEDLSGSYNCGGTVNNGHSNKTGNHQLVPASVEIARKGITTYEIRTSSPDPHISQLKFTSLTTTSDLVVDGNTFKYDGKMHSDAYMRDTIVGGCDFEMDAVGKIENHNITYSESRTLILENEICAPEVGNETLKVSCQKTTDNQCKNDYHRAVFIRPCAGLLFTDNKFSKTTVGGGTVQSVCSDLRSSCVSDIFIAFKSDGSDLCGEAGTLLYTQIGSSSKDPIMDLMKECADMNIHAWFPVFHDSYMIKMLGGAERVGQSAASEGGTTYSGIFAEPMNSDVVSYQLSLLSEIVAKYPLTGINLDYIRYAYAGEGDLPPGSPISIHPDAINDFVNKVMTNFPRFVISADVFADSGTRQEMGQSGVLDIVSVIMPMEYMYFSKFLGSDKVAGYGQEIKLMHLNKAVIPILRGWVCRTPSCSKNETYFDMLNSLTAGIQATKSIIPADGYAIFTYEMMLTGTISNSLKYTIDNQKLGF